jgi:prefoldin subunit 5
MGHLPGKLIMERKILHNPAQEIRYDEYIFDAAETILYDAADSFLDEVPEQNDLPRSLERYLDEHEVYLNLEDAIYVLRNSNSVEGSERHGDSPEDQLTSSAVYAVQSDIRGVVQDVFNSYAEAYEGRLEELESDRQVEYQDLENEVDELRENLEGLDTTIQELLDAEDQDARVNKTLVKLNKQKASLEKKIAALEEKMKDLEDSIDELPEEEAKKLLEKAVQDNDPRTSIHGEPLTPCTWDEYQQIIAYVRAAREVGMRGDGPLGSAYVDARRGACLSDSSGAAFVQFDQGVSARLPHWRGKGSGDMEDYLVKNIIAPDEYRSCKVDRKDLFSLIAHTVHSVVVSDFFKKYDNTGALSALVDQASTGKPAPENIVEAARPLFQAVVITELSPSEFTLLCALRAYMHSSFQCE